MISDDLPFTAVEAVRQQAILDAEFAAGWFEPPPDDWQLADAQDSPGLGPGNGMPGGGGSWAGELPWLTGENPPSAPVTPPGKAEPAELLPCGIVAHDAAGSGGTGFASGSVLDTLAPGPVLTGALDDAHIAGLAGLPDDELAGVILAARRSESRALADLLAATGELHRRRMSHPDRRVGEHAAAELGILMTLTSRAAIGLMDQAAAMRRLPATMAALRAGRIDRTRAAVIAFETELIEDDAVASAVELLVIEDAPGLDPARLRRRLRRAVAAVDSGAVRRRKERAAKDARVELVAEQSGNAQLAGRELPAVAAIAADARIDAAARALKASGVKARLTQLRAAVFLSLLTGSDPLQFLPPGPAQTDSVSDTDAASTGTASTGAAETDTPSAAPAGAASAGAETADSETAGAETAGAETGRTDATGQPGPADPPGDPARPGDGQPVSALSGHGPPGHGLSGGELPVTGSVHLTVPVTTWLELTGNPGEVPGYGVTDGDTSRDLADRIAAAPTSTWCLTVTDAAGRAIAHACARHPPPASPGQRTRWLRKLKITRIEAGTCTHAREAPGYRIPAALHHIVQVRQRTCAAPCCSRPAVRCDTDHTLAFDDGGRTCECDLSPLCRRDHQAKQAPGWHLEQPQPGVLVWRLPHGRTYTVQPDTYPI